MFEWFRKKKVNPMVTAKEKAANDIYLILTAENYTWRQVEFHEVLSAVVKKVLPGYGVKANPYVKHARQIKMKGENDGSKG